jgi:hypothetical protein
LLDRARIGTGRRDLTLTQIGIFSRKAGTKSGTIEHHTVTIGGNAARLRLIRSVFAGRSRESAYLNDAGVKSRLWLLRTGIAGAFRVLTYGVLC